MNQKVSTPWLVNTMAAISSVPSVPVDVYASFFFSSGIRYVLAELGTSCNAGCKSVGLKCVANGFDGQDVKKVYESIGQTCKSEEGYIWPDQPCIRPRDGHCYGTTNLSEAGIDCAPGDNGSVRRLCPCV